MTMRLGVVAEFTDRASKRMAKMLRFNKKMEKIQKGQERLVKTQVKDWDKVTRATGRSSRSMGSLQRMMQGVANAGQSMSRGVVTFIGHIGRAIARVNSLRKSLDLAGRSRALVNRGAGLAAGGAGKIARGAVVTGGIAAGVTATAGAAASTVIGPAAQVENYMVQLESLEGSSAKAEKAMAWITDFATRTPLELPDVIESYRQLKTFGIDPTNGSMQALVDTMAMSGGGAEQLSGIVLAVGQAWTKGKLQGEEALQLLERGVPVWDLLTKATGKSAAQLQELGSKGKLGRDVIAKLVELMGERAVGASEKMSQTWGGMMSNLSDHWFQFRLMIADAGVFDWAKDKLQGFLETINQMKADGSLLKLAEEISQNIITTLSAMWEFGKGLWGVLQELGGWLKFAADALGGWNNLAMVFVALPFISTLAGIVTGIAQLGAGLAMIATGLAGLSLPVLAVIAVVMALGAAAWWIYNNWDQVVSWLASAWDWIVQKAQAAWETLKTVFAWHPLVMIINNWSEISDWFSNYWTKLKAEVLAGWEAVKGVFGGDIEWPSLPEISLPDFETVKQVVKAFFGFGWIPTVSWPSLPKVSVPDFADIKQAATVFFSYSWLPALKWPGLPKLEFPDLTTIKQTLIDFFSLDWLPDWEWPEIPLPDLPDIGGLISETAATASNAWNSLTGIFSDEDPISIAARDPASIERATHATNQLQKAIGNLATADASPALGKLNAIREVATGLPDLMSNVVNRVSHILAGIDFTYHGQRMIETIAAGMRARAHRLVEEIRNVTQAVRDHLPSSPAKVGPLSDIHRLKFSETMAQSIRPAPLVRAMKRAAAATLAAATLAGPMVAGPSLAAAAPKELRPSSALVGRPSGVSASSSASKTGSGTTIHFAPVITIGVGGENLKEQVMEALEEFLPELAAKLQSVQGENERLEF
ncbi:phage tape measure protein [Roseibium sp. TrichSKD4]|uniref:tape measure protein n=1 Tax=Roseibium sp. TrichSKD4 TaxID=744980 RepID=UPI0001E569C4|nr:tape measure protein [Roseibium sp. TrichSKD4]EFO32503.1 phage tape measure protein [Roseibium sp. TrichSKD4]